MQARADTLAQLPRLGWAVATDEDTMRDLTTDELAFRPHPGEHIEITQMRRGGGEPRRLLRLPVESDLALPVIPGTHVVVQGNEIHVVTVVSVEPRQRVEELVGILAVAKQLDPSPIAQRLAARGIDAELRTIRGSITLAGSRPSSVEVKVALAGPAAEGAELVAAKVGQARWPRWLSPMVLAVSLVAAVLLWRRGGAPQPRHEMAFGPFPTAAHAQPPAAPVAATAQPPPADLEITAQPVDLETTDQTDPEKTGEWVAAPQAATPAIGNPVVPEGAAPEERMRSGPFRTRRDLAGPLGFGVAVAACARATAAVPRTEGRHRSQGGRVAKPVHRVREAPTDDRRTDRGPGCRSLRRDAAGKARRDHAGRSRSRTCASSSPFRTERPPSATMTVT